tara:strand:- start:338 stop:766 length:429 start_codon:yes stop_codon:yes gene_type:complete
MATRALINFVERKDGVSFSEHPGVDQIHVQIYHHYDGYPEYLGVKLANLLDGYNIVNGISHGMQGPYANGMSCLTAQIVGLLKDGPGNVYLQKPVEKDWEDYEYFIWVKDHADIWISILDYDNNCIFVGKPEKLLTKYEEKV